MTVTSDDPFFEQLLEERDRERRLDDAEWLRRRVPRVLDLPGEMHPEVAAWFAELVKPDHWSGNLLICGSLGTGKSWHLWRIVTELVLHHNGRDQFELATAYGFKQTAAPPTDYDALARFGQLPLLLLDDVGSVRLSDWDLDNLFGIVDQRWANHRPIVISSNALDMRSLLGERIASRLADGATLVELTGADRRRA